MVSKLSGKMPSRTSGNLGSLRSKAD